MQRLMTQRYKQPARSPIEVAELRRQHRALPPEAHLPAGRPTDYRAHYPQLVFGLRLVGLNDDRIAQTLDISTRTLRDWLTRFDEFAAEYRRGGAAADANVARSYYINCTTGHRTTSEKLFYDAKRGQVIRETIAEHHPPSAAAQAVWLANRQPQFWKSLRSATELTGSDGAPLGLPPVIVVRGIWSREEARACEITKTIDGRATPSEHERGLDD